MDTRDLDALVYPDRVHRSIYLDEAIFDEEMTKIFAANWVYLAHESQIPEPNDFVTTELGRRPLIITRGANGELNALVNRCAHRASTVCQEVDGNAKRFTCGYHGWTYSNDGALVGLPFPKGYPENFDKGAHGLHRLPALESYRGFIFGSMNPDVDDVATWLAGAKKYLDYFIDRAPNGNISVRHRHRLTYRGNWKLAWDNAGDGLHASFVHKSFALLNEARYGGNRSLSQFKHTPDDTGMFGEDLGNGHIFVDQRPGMSASFWETQRPIPGSEHAAATVRAEHGDQADAYLNAAPGSMINLSIFPNLLIKGNQMEILTPKSVKHTELLLWVCAAADAPDEINTMRLRVAEDFPTLGNPDDVEIYERCQQGLECVPEIEWMDLSKGIELEETFERDGNEIRRGAVTFDTPIRGYLREWKRAMAADPKVTLA